MALREITYPIQPNAWSCLPTACACLLQTQPSEIVDAIGHDGSAILTDDTRRGFHVEEIVDVFVANLQFPVPIEACPIIYLSEDVGVEVYSDSRKRLDHYLEKCPGILLGSHPDTGNPHAVVWDGETIYDPRGQIYTIDKFEIDCFLALF